MAKSARALSGAAKDAYLRRTLKAEPELPDEVRQRLGDKLRSEIASLSLRSAEVAAEAREMAATQPDETLAASTGAQPPQTTVAFDPYSPNVVVVIRTRGRQAVLEQLSRIEDVGLLRLLAREQQLGIEPALSSAGEIRLAIVHAAERRIANRRAAAS